MRGGTSCPPVHIVSQMWVLCLFVSFIRDLGLTVVGPQTCDCRWGRGGHLGGRHGPVPDDGGGRGTHNKPRTSGRVNPG